MTTTIIIMGLLIVFGIFLINGKGSFLTAGFNHKSEEELKDYDEVAVCKFMGKIMFALAFSMVFWLLGDIYDLNWLIVFGTVLFFGIMLYSLIYAYKWERFKK